MKTIYYVVQKQLETFDEVQETNGLKNVRAYEIKNGKMLLISEFELDNSDNTEKMLLIELETENLIQTHVHLIEL
jgi:hypothetical protein